MDRQTGIHEEKDRETDRQTLTLTENQMDRQTHAETDRKAVL